MQEIIKAVHEDFPKDDSEREDELFREFVKDFTGLYDLMLPLEEIKSKYTIQLKYSLPVK